MKTVKRILAMLMAMALVLALAGCGDKEANGSSGTEADGYIWDVVATVPKGEVFNANGLNVRVSNVDIEHPKNPEAIDCYMTVKYTLEDMGSNQRLTNASLDEVLYADGRRVSRYINYVDELIRPDDDMLDETVLTVDMTWETMMNKLVLDVTADYKFVVEIHPTWDGWPENQSVVFELN